MLLYTTNYKPYVSEYKFSDIAATFKVRYFSLWYLANWSKFARFHLHVKQDNLFFKNNKNVLAIGSLQ